MILFKIYYVSEAKNWTSKEETFFKDVQGCAYDAFHAQKRDMTIDEWNDNAFLFLTRNEVKTIFKKDVQAPSVVVAYRANSNEQYKAAFLKGVGNLKAWKAAFVKIFDGVATDQTAKGNGEDKTQRGSTPNGSDDTNGSGFGNGNGVGFGNGLGGGWLKYLFLGGAGLCAFSAVSAKKPPQKMMFGAGAAALSYLAFKDDIDAFLGSKKK